ncbi:hypothetical protein TWF569_011684 [Orbilia oligospora]|uniref:Uncharacterized protein n=2 Tax=Orbilia oligospora TaxID=2813651 RepID=G1XKY3_ARTOA|nr:hypothetical protein AOL_s00110g153 [Orbilia oligospora ATCC 24927]KAF3081164.1 hypothetical protein TWF706_002366 [Orbilia oligospora]EGX46329.1 hypothetical protein AOL_s00110g153 [Orbilia oligospora ATCC 24927]KAF3081165.1 hypothetical protein TWF706_002366 [Orbilia oligospora]KAF3089210.1 hypothetical protein TWF102_009703 [Orbilia oligospora]KAF3101472.1 hypothetical protein TWF103_007894 [Orbilia oligospora]
MARTALIIALSTAPILTLASFFKSKPKPPPTFLSKLLPIIATLIILVVIAVVLYLVWKTAVSVGSDVQSRLDSGGVKLSKSGADVELKGLSYEKYRDLTQQVVVSAWNTSETKDFNNRFFTPRNKGHNQKKPVPQTVD